MTATHDPRVSGPGAQITPVTSRQGLAPAVVSARPGNCDRCSAPVAADQRYCVSCGNSQRHPDDPTARWFASARRARAAQLAGAPVAGAGDPTGRTISTRTAAILIALLPVAAGVGVIVGRGTSDSGEQVVAALQALKASGGLAAGTGATDAATSETADASDDAGSGKKVDGIEVGDKQAEILATGIGGSARKIEGGKPTAKDVAESKKALQQIEAKKGEAYVEQQKDLPDVIVVP